MDTTEKVQPRKRQIEGWRQHARRVADTSRRTRRGAWVAIPAVVKEK